MIDRLLRWLAPHHVRLPAELLERSRQHARRAGYASTEEFIGHCVERGLATSGDQETTDEDKLRQRLRGLGYLE